MITMSIRVPPALILVAVFCAALPSCGDGTPGPKPTSPLPDLPQVSTEAKARFAIDRLVTGPLPRTTAFPIPKLHALNLHHAREDLAALPADTIALLSEPDVQRRIIRPGGGDRNPWHNVLEVLAALSEPPLDLLEAWTAPVLETNDLPLERRAVRALRGEGDRRFAPLLLAFLKRRPGDRELARTAFHALVAVGSPWRERALAVALRGGASLLWSSVADSLQRDMAAGEESLIWWSLLAEATGSTRALGNQRSIVPTWYPVRFLLDDSAWPQDRAALDRALPSGRHFAPADVLDAGGFLPVPKASSEVLCWQELLASGRRSAARARCLLAKADRWFYPDLVRRDLVGDDPDLRDVAERCGLVTAAPDDLKTVRALLQQFLAFLEKEEAPSVEGVTEALGQLFLSAPEEAAQVSAAILSQARPPDRYKLLLENAYDLLATHDITSCRALVADLVRSNSLEDRATALTLIQRSRDIAYAPAIDELHARALLATEADGLRRLLIWLHTEDNVGREALATFAPRYVAWIEEAPDPIARALAPGLLDLGEIGARAYADGLSGPRRHIYVEGLLERSGLVRPVVAEALLAPLDGTTSREERLAVFVAVFRVAPMDAAPHLAAALDRLAPDVRSEAADVLEVLRHRAR